MEARRAKTRRAFGRGLVHDSRPPNGGTPIARCLVSPSVYWGITQKRVAIRVNFCNHEPSQMIFARPGKAAPNRDAEKTALLRRFFFAHRNARQPVL